MAAFLLRATANKRHCEHFSAPELFHGSLHVDAHIAVEIPHLATLVQELVLATLQSTSSGIASAHLLPGQLLAVVGDALAPFQVEELVHAFLQLLLALQRVAIVSLALHPVSVLLGAPVLVVYRVLLPLLQSIVLRLHASNVVGGLLGSHPRPLGVLGLFAIPLSFALVFRGHFVLKVLPLLLHHLLLLLERPLNLLALLAIFQRFRVRCRLGYDGHASHARSLGLLHVGLPLCLVTQLLLVSLLHFAPMLRLLLLQFGVPPVLFALASFLL